LKLFEYMGLGRAIIAPDQPNIREILTDEQDALLFRDGDAAHFKSQIMRLCGDEVLRRRLGEGARHTIDERGLTWDNNATRALAKARR
jgi:glycosyltransferase involved in cell wall biosynthesis